MFCFYQDFGISTGLAARLDGMSIENLGGFHDDSDEDDNGEFDIKQSSREDINNLNVSQSNSFQTSFDRLKTDDKDRKQRSSMFADAAEKYKIFFDF